MNKTVGPFTIETSDPYPCWTTIKYGQQAIHNIHHEELRDLEFAIKRAIQHAMRKLPVQDKHEVD